jgi:ATP-dependent helicase/nuclease subunit A
VPVIGDGEKEGWLEVLNSAIYPPQETRRSASAAPACPAFGENSVLDRGPESTPPAGGSIRPGLYAPNADRPQIVWWDPAVLELDVEEQVSLRQQRILEPDPDGMTSAESEENYSGWKRARDEALVAGSRPSISNQTVTAASREIAANGNFSDTGADSSRKRYARHVVVYAARIADHSALRLLANLAKFSAFRHFG